MYSGLGAFVIVRVRVRASAINSTPKSALQLRVIIQCAYVCSSWTGAQCIANKSDGSIQLSSLNLRVDKIGPVVVGLTCPWPCSGE